MAHDFIDRRAYSNDDDAFDALTTLGLEAELLTDAARRGVEAAQSITDFHPVTARGYLQWSETVAVLRESLHARGWSHSDPRNSPRSFSPDGDTAVMVMGGNANTAIAHNISPRPARRRGPATKATVETNNQLMLDITLPMPANWRTQTPLTWVLLYHWSATEPVLRSELSLPYKVTDDGEIVGWRHRILLPEQGLGEFQVPLRPAGPQDDVDFRIEEIQ